MDETARNSTDAGSRRRGGLKAPPVSLSTLAVDMPLAAVSRNQLVSYPSPQTAKISRLSRSVPKPSMTRRRTANAVQTPCGASTAVKADNANTPPTIGRAHGRARERRQGAGVGVGTPPADFQEVRSCGTSARLQRPHIRPRDLSASAPLGVFAPPDIFPIFFPMFFPIPPSKKPMKTGVKRCKGKKKSGELFAASFALFACFC